MRILIAEDDQVLADGLLRTLRASGAAADHVASGSEADAALMTNTEFDLLILDDLSYVRRDQAETSVLFELISERYERKSLAIPANTPFSQWGEVFVEPAMTLAAVDRLVHHSTILEMNVESYRRRAAQAGHARPARKASSTT